MSEVKGQDLAVEVEVSNSHFSAWYQGWGQAAVADDDCGQTIIYRFFDGGRDRGFEVPAIGGSFGFCACGTTEIEDEQGMFHVKAGEWFTMPRGLRLSVSDDAVLVINQRVGWLGLRAMGGPVETLGRLRYIDTCSDTLLAPPPVRGDPCMNLLHFPAGIVQTEHQHPSTRSGIVIRGAGWCETPYGRSRLVPGLVFYIPKDGLHRFVTEDQTMDVIAYHPDSDWGPTDETHPMVNRTLVEGQKIDNTVGVHTSAEVAGSWD